MLNAAALSKLQSYAHGHGKATVQQALKQWRHRSAGGPLTDFGLGALTFNPRAPPLDPNQLK